MIEMNFKTLAARTGGTMIENALGESRFEGAVSDSRQVKSGMLFIAIRGERDDGHKYIDEAVRHGCSGVLVADDYKPADRYRIEIPLVAVNDTHRAMIDLAADYRRSLAGQLIAITGSNGKTTTKDITYAMLGLKSDRVYCSPGNFNNLYGLPLSLFGLPADTEFAVFELGISVPGEMNRLANMARPDLMLFTNVGPTHLATLGSVEGVAEAKFEMVDAADNDRPVIINGDDPELVRAAARRRRRFITFGIDSRADFTGRRGGVTADGYPTVIIDDVPVRIGLFGDHQAYNILAGYAVCKTLGLDITADDLNHIEYRPAPYRGEIEIINDLVIIADCYNANPVSMRSGLRSFRSYLDRLPHKKRGVVVVGDMLELGPEEIKYHEEVGRLLAELDFDLNIIVGERARTICDTAFTSGADKDKFRPCADTKAAGEPLIGGILRGDAVYLKASRGIGLEELITLMKGSAFRQN